MLYVSKYITFNVLIQLSFKVVAGYDHYQTLTEGINGTIIFKFLNLLALNNSIVCFSTDPYGIIYNTSSYNKRITHEISGYFLNLYFKILEITDNGYYYCQSGGRYGPFSSPVTVTINESPIMSVDGINITEDRVFIVANRQKRIMCYSRRRLSSHNFIYYFDSKRFDPKNKFTMNDSFKILGCSQVGNFKIQFQIQLFVIEMEILQDIQLKANFETILSCKIKSYVQLNPYWTFNSSLILGSINKTIDENMYKIVNNFTLKLAKNYNNEILTCWGDIGKPLLYVSKVLNVSYIPDHITINPPEMEVNISSATNKVFECNADGNPMPNYRWLFQNTEISSGSVLDFNRTFKREDNGEYFCEAYNSEGKITKGARLYLLFSDSDISPLSIRWILVISSSLIFIIILVIIFIIIWKRKKKLKDVIPDNLIQSSSYSTERIENMPDVIEKPINIIDSLKEPVYSIVNKKQKCAGVGVTKIQPPENEINPTKLTYASLLFEDEDVPVAVIRENEIINYAEIDFIPDPNEIENSNRNETIYENTRISPK